MIVKDITRGVTGKEAARMIGLPDRMVMYYAHRGAIGILYSRSSAARLSRTDCEDVAEIVADIKKKNAPKYQEEKIKAYLRKRAKEKNDERGDTPGLESVEG